MRKTQQPLKDIQNICKMNFINITEAVQILINYAGFD